MDAIELSPDVLARESGRYAALRLIVMPVKAGIRIFYFPGFRVAPAIASLPGMTVQL